MDIRVETGDATGVETDLLIVPVTSGDAPDGVAATVDATVGGHLADAMRREEFKAEAGQTISFPGPTANRVCFVGAGKAEEVSLETVRRIGGSAARAANGGRFATMAVCGLDAAPFDGLDAKEVGEALAIGIHLGMYQFTEYKTEEEARRPPSLTSTTVITGGDGDALTKGIGIGAITARGTALAMDLANHPSATATPTYMAEEAAKIANAHGNMSLKVIDKAEMETLGMGGMVGVSQGSVEPPKFIILDYKGGKGDPIVLVGKTITFDSGGISIKPSAGMEEMKGDMSGGAAVLGAIQAIAELELPVHVVGILVAAENMPSGTAINPGDILNMYNGLTVEVINTDAEGRLVLADGLSYAADKLKPRCLVDIATLTGACVVALGHHAIGLMGNDDACKQAMEAAATATGERVWELPLWDEYHEDLKSTIADLKNTGGRAGGTITAGCFLSRFVGDTPWLHLDIASTAWSDKNSDYLPKGAHGTGVRLMTNFVSRLT